MQPGTDGRNVADRSNLKPVLWIAFAIIAYLIWSDYDQDRSAARSESPSQYDDSGYEYEDFDYDDYWGVP